MVAKLATLAQLLEETGYQKSPSGQDVMWRLSTDDAGAAVRAKIEILERKSQFHISKCTIQIDSEKLSEILKANIKKRMPRLLTWLSFTDRDGRLRSIAEIAPQNEKKDLDRDTESLKIRGSGTSIGWTTSFTQSNGMISIQLTDAFSVGDPIANWWADISASVAESIAPHYAKSWDTRHLQELLIPIAALPIVGEEKKKPRTKSGTREFTTIELPTPLKVSQLGTKTIIETAPSPSSSSTSVETPIEILEARETSLSWQAIDSKIVQRKSIRSLPANGLTDSDLFARVAVAPELKFPEQYERLENYLRSQKHSSLLTLTGAIKIAGDAGREQDKLQLISDLLRRIGKSYGPIDSIKPLMRIAPEILGDSWAAVDPVMAYKAWNAALERADSNPRIHQKISNLARKTGDTRRELDALLALTKQERRKREVGILAIRLIRLIKENPDIIAPRRDEVMQSLERLCGTMPENVSLAIAMSNQLRVGGKHRQALAVLDTLLSSAAQTISGIELAELNIAIARIWRYDEENLVLATARYIQATSENAKASDDMLAEAEAFFAETKYDAQLRRILRLRSEQSDSASGTAALERSARYFIDSSQPEEAIKDILKLLQQGRAQQWYLDIIEASQQISDFPWTEVSKAMLEVPLSQLPKDSASNWTLVAGRLGLKSPSLKEESAAALTEVHVVPLLNADDSASVCVTLRELTQFESLAEFISNRLPFASGPEYSALLTTIVDSCAVGKDGLFENAIAEQAFHTKDLTLSMERARKLIRDRRKEDLVALCRAHQSTMTGGLHLAEFHDYVLTQLCRSGHQDFASVLDEILEIRMIQDGLDDESRAQWIKLVIKSGFLSIGSRHLENEIRDGKTCLDDENIVSEILVENTPALAQWHGLSREKAPTPSLRLHHAQKCFALWIGTDERPASLIDILIELNNARKLNTEQLELLEHLCTRENRIKAFVAALSTYINGTKEDARAELIHWGIRTINSRLHMPEVAAEHFLNWIGDRQEYSIQELFTAGTLYYLGDSFMNAQANLLRMLNNPECLKEKEILLAALDSLSKCRIDRANLATVTQTLISWSRTGSDISLTDKLVQRSVDWHVAGIDDLNHLFVNNFGTETTDRLATMAVQILSKADRLNSGAAKTISEWQDDAGLMRHKDKWTDLIALLNRDRFLGLLRRSARCEVLHLHAKTLFDDDVHRFDSIPQFEALANENPMDSRAWIPLYSLYEESGARQKLTAHLERIIPLIMRDKSVLERTPFNLESLKNSLRRARLSSPPGAIGNFEEAKPLKSKNFEIQERAAQMQRAWIAATPVVQISTPTVAGSTGLDNISLVTPLQTFEVGLPEPLAFNGSSALNIATNVSGLDTGFHSESTKTETNESSIKTREIEATTRENDPEKYAQINWRDLVITESTSANATESIMKMAFTSEIEKHIAVQCIALLNGETRSLDAWHWTVWRNPDSFDYSISPAGRLPENEKLKYYGGGLHKLLRMLSPIMTRANQHKFTADGKLLKLGLSNETSSVEVGLDHPALQRGSLRYFTSLIQEARIKFRDTPLIGPNVFIDLRVRAIHFDSKWQMNLPPTVLAYRALDIISNFQRGQTTLIDLDPLTEMIPVIDQVKEVLTSSGMSRLRIAFGMQHREISEQLRGMNREQLIALLTGAGSPSARDLSQLQHEMRLRSLATVLASTLDVVGLLESLSGKDLCDEAFLTPKKILTIHPYAREILAIAAKLTI